MKNVGKSKNLLVILLSVTVLLLVGGSALISMLRSGYRSVQLYQLDGDGELMRGASLMKPYTGMMLQSEDRLSTFAESYMFLKMDDDKFLLAEPETRFSLVAGGSRSDSRTRIELESGSVVDHITMPLLGKSSYEVTTPNSTMAIRGTSFRISVWYDEEGVSHTELQVFEGTVETHLIYPDGSSSVESRYFSGGYTVLIRGDESTSEYVSVEDKIDYYSLPIPTLEFLKIGVEGLDGYDITRDELDEILELKLSQYTVSFKVDGRLFATQSVQWDHCVQEPTLRPAATGRWDWDFDTPITEDTEILWVSR